MIEIKNISKSFGDKKVLTDVSITINKGEPLFIMGKSGIGKTTLINIILGFIKADSGEISGMENLKKAVMFQEDRLCENISAMRNIKITCNKSEADITEAFLKVGFNAEDISKPVYKLSGGMKRRVALVRCMLYEGDFIVMDEPFKGLDGETRDICAKFVKERLEHVYSLIVSHDLDDMAKTGGKMIKF